MENVTEIVAKGPEKDHEPKTVTIVVDGTPHEVPKKEDITYAEVVTLAYPDYPQHPEITYSVTYTRGARRQARRHSRAGRKRQSEGRHVFPC